MTDDLDKKIEILEDEWNKHHKNPREHRMPDMIELTKLRATRKKLNMKDRWES